MKKKRLLTLMALAVMAVGAWADPTMTLTVKTTDKTPVVIFSATSMSLSTANHWSHTLTIPDANKNKLLEFNATYNDGNGGSDVVSGSCYMQVSEETEVTFYAKYANDKAFVSCDGMSHNFGDSSWRVLGTIKPSIGNETSSVILNIYLTGNQDCQQMADCPQSVGTYYRAGAKYNGTDRLPTGCALRIGAGRMTGWRKPPCMRKPRTLRSPAWDWTPVWKAKKGIQETSISAGIKKTC